MFTNRQHAGELMRDDLVGLACKPGTLARTGRSTSRACPCCTPGTCTRTSTPRARCCSGASRPALLDSAPAAPARHLRTPFDANDPVNTPRDLNTANPRVRAALRGAVDDVNGLGKGLAVTLREVQFEKRGDEKIPIHGGPGDPEGDFNAINVPWVPGEGYPDVPHGSSFVMAAQFTATTARTPRTILTYSQSTNPTSPYFADQTRMFSRKEWVDMGFCEREILARPDADDPAPRAVAAARAGGRSRYRLPLRRRERIRRVRATVNGKRVKVRRVGRRGVRVSLRGRPKARYRIRVPVKTSRERTIRLDRRARTCTPRLKGRRR